MELRFEELKDATPALFSELLEVIRDGFQEKAESIYGSSLFCMGNGFGRISISLS
jgi:hypothetical protein